MRLTQAQKEYIKENISYKSTYQIAREIGIAQPTVYKTAAKMGLDVRKSKNCEKNEIIFSLFMEGDGKYTAYELAELTGLCLSTVRNIAWKNKYNIRKLNSDEPTEFVGDNYSEAMYTQFVPIPFFQ